MNRYTFAAVLSGGDELERQADGDWERDARQKVWRELTDEQCNACESIECVDVEELT